MSTIPTSFYSQVAYNTNQFEDGPTMDWFKANQETVDNVVLEALWRAFQRFSEIGFSRAEISQVGIKGVIVSCTHEDYCRGCHMGSYTYPIELSWSELLDPDANPANLVETRWHEAQAAEKLAKQEFERKEKAAQLERARPEREAKELAEYQRLKAKFGLGSSENRKIRQQEL